MQEQKLEWIERWDISFEYNSDFVNEVGYLVREDLDLQIKIILCSLFCFTHTSNNISLLAISRKFVYFS